MKKNRLRTLLTASIRDAAPSFLANESLWGLGNAPIAVNALVQTVKRPPTTKTVLL
jgi:hypothetical protein